MSLRRLLSGLLVVLALTVQAAQAQIVTGPTADSTTRVDVVIEPHLVRFATAGDPLRWRLEIATAQGERIFDSGPVDGRTLDWPLLDEKSQPVENGVYTYTLTIQASRGETERVHRGQLTVARAGTLYDVTASTDDPTGVGALNLVGGTDGSTATAEASAGGPGRESAVPSVVQAPEWGRRRLSSSVNFAPAPLISGSGTTNTMTKWSDGPNGIVADANVTEINGSVVVGNGTFRGNLQIFGPADKDVFAGMGPNLLTGPGFNFGYAGESFGRSAGFFNVRPDVSAVAPNPSLRFMTANAERMIITNAGRVGIGTSAPNAKLYVEAAETFGLFAHNTGSGSIGVFGQAVGPQAANSIGVLGRYDGPDSTSDGWGVFGYTPTGYAGVFGSSNKNGVFGQTSGASHSGVFGKHDGDGWGVFGYSANGFAGVFGSGTKNGVYGQTASASDSGVFGKNDGSGNGVTGWSLSGDGVVGEAHAGNKSGVYGFTTDGLGCGGCFASFGAGLNRALGVTGNAIQSRDGGGMAKAMAFVDPFVNPDPAFWIVRCYNSQATGSPSTPPCGFSIPSELIGVGHYVIDFGFQVSDRFVSVTPQNHNSENVVAEVNNLIDRGPNRITVRIGHSNEGTLGNTHRRFYIVIY